MLRKGSNQRKATRGPREANRRDSNRDARGSRSDATNGSLASFVLYVEGARDREILACWARTIDRDLARIIQNNAVILGGRQPARAVSDFRKRGGADEGLSGLVVLDRDDLSHESDDPATSAVNTSPERPASATVANGPAPVVVSEEPGLRVFVWGLRHIESYLLVPQVLRRLAGLGPEDRRIERFVEAAEYGANGLHAKRVLGPQGSLTEVIGMELRAGDIARAMRRDEFHRDIVALFDHISGEVGLSRSGPEVVVRARMARDDQR